MHKNTFTRERTIKAFNSPFNTPRKKIVKNAMTERHWREKFAGF
jgi:hypothetical protein